ncbi:hypothetical protein AN225_05595 [Leuconostoc lactis]|nr:hypothetical protein AN225_05595 [Leuconostoc lactis]QEA51415.1 hypothetical protein FGL78_07240 [Leuconostoc lactis]
MAQHQVVGMKSSKVYFKGDAIACRRYINDNSVVKQLDSGIPGKRGKKRSEFGFDEALRIV